MFINQYGRFTESDYDARIEGWLISAPIGQSTHYKNFMFNCLFSGVTIGSDVSKYGSHITMIVEYLDELSSQWKRYKKFSKEVNLHVGGVAPYLLFPTKPTVGTRLRVDVLNSENSTIGIGMDLFKFTESEIVSTSNLEQGEDW